jgi:hypothetical protein
MAEMHRWMREDAAPGMETLALNAYDAAVHSEFHAGAAEAAANFKGNWSSLTGALNRPASVAHADKLWILLSNLANVTTAEPGVSPAWVEYTDDAYMVAYNATTVGATLDTMAHLPSVQTGTNKLANSNFSINQRSVTGTVTLSPGQYGHDRWKAGSGGCTYTFALASGVTTLTITAGSLQQAIEGSEMGSGMYVLSWTGTAQGRITTGGTYGASGVTANMGGGVNRIVEFNAGTLSRVKFEPGTVPTPYRFERAADDLARCQRYYEVGVAQLSGYTGAATGQHTRVFFKVTKRATPTLTYGVTATNNVGTFDVRDPAVDGARWYCITTAAGAFQWDGTWTASAEL